MQAVLPLFLGLLGLASSAGPKRGASSATRLRTQSAPSFGREPVDAPERAAVNAAITQAIKEEFINKPAAKRAAKVKAAKAAKPKPKAGTGKTMPARAAMPKKPKPQPTAAAKPSRLSQLRDPFAGRPLDVEADASNEAPSSIPKRTPQQAAQDLRAFLQRTKRFGSKNDRVSEVTDAQEDLGVKPDGIVGPETRQAAKRYGVTLPVRG